MPIFRVLLFGGFLLYTASSLGQVLTAGRVAVLEFSGSSGQGGPYTIREFAPDGTPGAVFNVPDSGPDGVVGVLSSTTAAQMSRSSSGHELLFTGFASYSPNGVSLTSTTAAAVPRVVGRLDAAGNFSRIASTSTYYDGGQLYAVASDGVNVWVAGSDPGICYLGPGPAQVINTPSLLTFGLTFASGDLFAAGGTSVSRVGSGGPSVPASTIPLFSLSGTAMDVQISPDGLSAYAVKGFDRVSKWSWNGTTWVFQYDLMCAPGNWLVRIAVDFSGNDPVIYGVHNLPTKLVKWVDQGPGSAEQFLVSGTGYWYGVALTPTTCVQGTPCDDGDPMTVNDVLDLGCNCLGQLTDCEGVPGGPVLPGTPCDDGDPLTGGDLYQIDCGCAGTSLLLQAKVLLDGALPPGWFLMHDSLRVRGMVPMSEPYTALGLPPTPGGQSIAPSVLSVTGGNAVVDWVLIELRDPVDPSVVSARRAVLLQRDGDVVDLDGISPVRLPAAPDAYHIAIRHRNHLGVMTAFPVAFGGAPVSVDLRQTSTPLFGSSPCRTITSSIQALWSGDANGDGLVKYVGTANDRDDVLNTVGGVVPTQQVSGYSGADIGMDGTIRYLGSANDRDPILNTLGGLVPTLTRQAQLP